MRQDRRGRIVEVNLSSPRSQSFRAAQVASRLEYDKQIVNVPIKAEIPSQDEAWNVGLIVGPSGSGKSSLLKSAFSEWPSCTAFDWNGDACIDDFPQNAALNDILLALSAAGVSSVPAWLTPYRCLSAGQQARIALARALVEYDKFVYDEFSSLLDRVVARTSSIAISKAVRKANKRVVLVSPHYDVAEWLEADWTLDTATWQLARGRLQRPRFDVSIHPASRGLWPLFAPHHYMSSALHPAARCFVCMIDIAGAHDLAGFMSFLPVVGYRHRWRGHRAVVRPEYQGIGIGSRFVDECFEIMACEDPRRKLSVVSSSLPLNIARSKSPAWRLTRAPSRTQQDAGRLGGLRRASDRLTTSWEYVPERQRTRVQRDRASAAS